MGKRISESEYSKANAQMKNCRDKNCPNGGANPNHETTSYCNACKSANKTARAYERTR